MSRHTILNNAQMQAADKATIAAGTAGYTLMRRAGKAVADAIIARYEKQPVLVLAGAGNNGGDGFVIARLLAAQNWPVQVALLGKRDALKGDAALAAADYSGEVVPFRTDALDSHPLVVDALFGTGLSRDVDGDARAMLEAVAMRELAVVAVDIPSGVDGDTGAVRGFACYADVTVTFHAAKYGHYLLPGREYCGELLVAEIGITEDVPQDVQHNHPDNWLHWFPWPAADAHKFTRGHVVVQGGDRSRTGAARLAARAALRTGAGVVTLLCDDDALPIYAATLEAVMTRVVEEEQHFIELMHDERVSAFLIGPAAGTGAETASRVATALAMRKPTVLDADALTAFARDPQQLFAAIGGTPTILTPHAGEFKRLFGEHDGTRIDCARKAAKASGAVVVLKGADTVIAAPDGQVAVNSMATPFLATAGAGDVLAGMVAALLGAGMPAFEAASAAVWLHGMAGRFLGAGLIAEDLPDMIPHVLQFLLDETLDYDPADHRHPHQ